MSSRPDEGRRTVAPFGTGQHGGEPLDREQGGRHGQTEKGDAARVPSQGGSGYVVEKQARARPRLKKK